MNLDWGQYQELVERAHQYADERFPEDKFHIQTTIWETGNFFIEAIHGKIDTSMEYAIVVDEDGIIVYEERKRIAGSREKEIVSGEILEADEDLTYEQWRGKRMDS